ncbi:hypothetical protein [Dysgonomonas sp. ZJ279]|uniref:hypothetical protein n=1 Tax=Dysgonomonas sp. ZJ279 TaxID=2709796 RepID=UPI0013EBEE3B|nr:hypothetical protein [Dysgonomonas sp. ZJ279]
MNIRLIPVIDITYYDQNIVSSTNGPYWEHTDEWSLFNKKCLKAAGFEGEMNPYSKGCSLYELAKITNRNLTKLVFDEIKDIDKDGNDMDCVGSLSGGYILNVDDEDILYPQCCGSLNDIKSWEELIGDEDLSFWIGHPSPSIIKNENSIVFDLEHSNVNENYVPNPNKFIVEVNKNSLTKAIDDAKLQLEIFSVQLLAINATNQWNISDIDKLLIYGE